MRHNTAVAAGFAGLLFSLPALAQTLPAPSLNFPQVSGEGFTWGASVGLDFSTGKLGANCAIRTSLTCTTSTTTLIDIPMSGMVQIDRLRLEATVPWVDIRGPGRFAGVYGVPVIVAPASTDRTSRSGIGDITVGAAFAIIREDIVWPRVEVEGVTKLPTAGDSLGTGKTDYGAQLNLFKTLVPGLTAFGSLGYQWIGEINTVQLHSGVRATGGAEFRFLPFSAGALIDYRHNAWQGAPDYFAFDPYVRLDLFAGIGVGLYGTFGLTHSTPGSGFGVRFTI